MKAAGAIVIRNNKVLIQKRFRKKNGFVYEFPAGKVENGEDYIQAAIRELWEETGLRSEPEDRPPIILKDDSSDFSMGFVFLKINGEDEPKRVDERRLQTFYWMTFEEIPLETLTSVCKKFIELMKN